MTQIILEQSLAYPFQDYLIKNKIDFSKCRQGNVTVFRCILTNAQQTDVLALLRQHTNHKGKEKQT